MTLERLRIAHGAFGLIQMLPTDDYPEAKATLWLVRDTLNGRLKGVWGRELDPGTEPNAARTVESMARRLRRAAEIVHVLPIESFSETDALLKATEGILDRELKMLWEEVENARYGRPPLLHSPDGAQIVPFRQPEGSAPPTSLRCLSA